MLEFLDQKEMFSQLHNLKTKAYINYCWATRSLLGVMLAHAKANISELGSYLNQLQYQLCLEIEIKEKDLPQFIPGRSAELFVREVPVGIIGEVHPQVLDKWGIKMPSVMWEIDLSAIA